MDNPSGPLSDDKQREARLPVSQQKQRALPPDKRTVSTTFARAVGAYLPKVTAAVFERYGFHSAEIMTSWAAIAGGDIARLTRPLSIKWPRGDRAADDERGGGATLIVACDPAHALEISYRTGDIVDRINRYFGYRAVARLTVKQTPRMEPAYPKHPPSASSPSAANTKPADLTEALAVLGHSVGKARSR